MHVDARRLERHVTALAAAPRPVGSDALRVARELVARNLAEAGWSIEPCRFVAKADDSTSVTGVNLVASLPEFTAVDRPWFCLGAHVDSQPDSPGADDNASAVAALLEVARLMPGLWPDEPRLNLELVAFDLEELGMLGGEAHARRYQQDGRDLRGMVSLEMLGYCDNSPQSQSLPRSLVGLYPDTGDFIAVIGNQNSEQLIEQFRIGMERVEGLPVETLCVPENGNLLQATRLSDHSPFWDAGYPALMITDTSFLRNPFYHTSGDTPSTLDFDFLHGVAEGCLQAVRHVLASGLGSGF